MHRNRFFGISLPFYAPDDLGGGGGAASDAGSGGGNAALDNPAEPSVIELDDNALVKIKGSDKPVKFGEHVRGFQSQWTKAAQRAKQLEQQLQERETRLKQIEQERAAASRQPSGQTEDVFQALRALPYLSGEDAVGVVQGIAQQIKQRDQVLIGTLKQLQKMQQIVNNLNQNHQVSSWESKLDRILEENGWSKDYKDLAKEVYLAYEGDDLDQEFPNIFRSRIDQLRKAMENERQAAIRKARPQPFVPGRGGSTGPSKPLEIKNDSRGAADQLWDLFSHKTET
jgi:hypothetical protein